MLSKKDCSKVGCDPGKSMRGRKKKYGLGPNLSQFFVHKCKSFSKKIFASVYVSLTKQKLDTNK